MSQTQILDKNPHLYSFLPILYLIWSDANLREEEIQAVCEIIDGDQSWTEKDRKLLMGFLDPQNPPSPVQLKSWLADIRMATSSMSPEAKTTLSAIGMKLALAKRGSTDFSSPDQALGLLSEIEESLGIVSREAAYHLHAKERNGKIADQSHGSSFPIEEMSGLLDGKRIELINDLKALLKSPEFGYYEGVDKEGHREQVLKWCQLLADQGYGALGFPEEYGGKSDMEGYFQVMETLSHHDLSLVIKFGVQFGLWGMSVYFLGTESHHAKYLKAIGDLTLPGCFAMTETGHGSNVKGIETTATYHHEAKTLTIHTPHYRAGKEYIGNAALHGQKATVFAKLIIDGVDYGVNAFVVPLRNEQGEVVPGVTIKDCGHKMGLNGVDNGRIWFDQVQIPVNDMLDRYASIDERGMFTSPIASDTRRFFTMLGTLVGGRIGIPRSGLSALKSGLTIAIRYGDERRQFGPESGEEVPILNYKSHQRRLLPRLAEVYGLHFALRYLTDRFLLRSVSDMQEIEALAAGLKAYTTWRVTDGLQECREACGGKGYLSENRIDQLKNDTDIYTTFEGDNTVLMQLVAKGRLSEFKNEFADINLFGMIGYVASQARTSLSERNPITTRNTDQSHLLSADFHMAAFQFRERHILTTAARRIKALIDDGMDSFEAFNQTQNHMISVGHAYVERVVLEQFQLKVANTESDSLREVLSRLCQLYALSTIERHKGWYLEHDYMLGVKTKAIRKLVNQLCAEVRKDAVSLVDAFNIPDELLGAPIASRT